MSGCHYEAAPPRVLVTLEKNEIKFSPRKVKKAITMSEAKATIKAYSTKVCPRDRFFRLSILLDVAMTVPEAHIFFHAHAYQRVTSTLKDYGLAMILHQ
jgi:hypothetical protein